MPRSLPGIDEELVLDWIQELGVGAVTPLDLTPLGDGKSNLTYLVEDTCGSRWVLRRPPLGNLLPSAHDVAREGRILARLAGSSVPTPRTIALREPDERLDVPLLLMEYVSGVVVDSTEALDSVPLHRRYAIGLSLARTLSTIHGVDLEAVGLNDLASHGPYAARQLKRWRRQFADSKTRGLPLVDELAGRFERNAPRQTEVTLVHGDFHLLNAITNPEDGAVRAIIDWELCTLGDPLADLGGLLAYWPQADDPFKPTRFSLPSRPGFPTRAELVAAYAEASGRDVSAVAFWEALGCWKRAIIGEGVLRRRLDEPGNGDHGGYADAVVSLLERASWVAGRAGF